MEKLNSLKEAGCKGRQPETRRRYQARESRL